MTLTFGSYVLALVLIGVWAWIQDRRNRKAHKRLMERLEALDRRHR